MSRSPDLLTLLKLRSAPDSPGTGPRWWLSISVFAVGLFLVMRQLGQSDVPIGELRPPRQVAVLTDSVEGVLRPKQPPPPIRSQIHRRDGRELAQRSPRRPGSRKETRSVPSSGTYVVAKNENMWGIARRYLGQGSRWTEIAAANPQVDPKRLREGTQLVIPGVKATRLGVGERSEAGGKSTKREAAPAVRYHVVRPGETLSHIAVEHYEDRDWRRILKANRKQVPRPTALREGMKLIIPPEPVTARHP